MSRYLSKAYAALEVYTPGEQPKTGESYIKLNTNESPYPPHPEVIRAAKRAAEALQLYSDPRCAALRDALAARYDVARENVYVANGSDDILNFSFMAFAGKERKAYFADITYGFYKVFCDLHGIEYCTVPLRDDLSLRPEDYIEKKGFIVIANPNAPTGLALEPEDIESVIKTHPDDVVLVDEAYVDFGARSCVPLTKVYDNLIVTQTFSKSRSMAGARLGFAIASEGLIEDLDRIKYSTNPYNVNSMTLAAGAEAIARDDYYMDNCRKIIAAREAAREALIKRRFTVPDSKANFLFIKHPAISGEALYQKLKDRGILVRHFGADRIKDYNRVTVGTPEQMDAVIRAIDLIMEGL